eukprot:m.206623 g.206623  ORF g.206623 m.206623 type:complete len:1224 (-) comp17107_c0_seq3:47-3718(-)
MMRMMGSRWIGAALAVLLCSCSALQCADDGSVTPLEVTSLQVLANVGEEQASQVAHLKLINVDLTQNGLASINWTKFTLSTFAISFIKSPMDTFESRHLGPLAATLIQLCFETTSLASLSNTSFTNMPRLTRLLLNDEPRLSYASDVFKPVPKLATLQLSRANINTISAAMFAPLTALTTLVLANNDLTELNSQALAHLPLKNLDLSVSAITSLNSSVLAPFPGLTELQISRMSLTRIPNTTFDSVPKLETLIWSGSVRRFIQVPVTERHLYPLTSLSRIDLDHHAISRDHIEQWGAAFADRHPLLTTFQAKFARLRVVPPFLQHLQHIARVVLSFNPITSWVKLRPKSLLDLDLLATEQLQRIPKDSLPEHGVMQLLWQVTQTPGLPYSTCAFGSDGWRCTCSNNTRPTNPLQPSDCELMCPDLVIDQQTYQGIVGTVVNTSCSLSEPPFQQATCEFDEASRRARWVGELLTPTRVPYAHQCASGLVVNVLALQLPGSFPSNGLLRPVTRVRFQHCPGKVMLDELVRLLTRHGDTVTELTVRHCAVDAAWLKSLLPLSLPMLYSLDLSHNVITSLLEGTFAFQSAVQLRSLDLSYNAVTSLPRSFAGLRTDLTTIDLSYNHITSLVELSLPNERSLLHIDLSYNAIVTLGADILFHAYNLSRLDEASLRMEGNPSVCWLLQLPTGYWTARCNCSTGLRNAPGCEVVSMPCSDQAGAQNISVPDICNGRVDCINGADEVDCDRIATRSGIGICPDLLDSCWPTCYRSLSMVLDNGLVILTPTPTTCADPGPACQPAVLSSNGVHSAVGLMGTTQAFAFGRDGNMTVQLQFESGNCVLQYAVSAAQISTSAAPGTSNAPSHAAKSSNTGIVVAVVLVAILSVAVLVFLYRRQRPEHSHRKAIEAQLMVALNQLNNASSMSQSSTALSSFRERDFVEGEILGKGQYGQVVGAVYKGNQGSVPQALALKTLLPVMERGDAMSQSLIELHLLAQLEHENIVRVYGLVIDRLPLTFVLELCPHGDLRAHLLSIQTRLPPTTELSIFIQLASALAYLHEKRILHRDLAARNVLLKSKHPCLIKLADFGLGRTLDAHADYYRATSQRELPFRWQAPEACLQAKHSMASDMWSLGVVMWEVLNCATRPYSSLGSMAEVLAYLRQGQRLSLPDGPTTTMSRIVQSCWQGDPALRPTAGVTLAQLRDVEAKESYVRATTTLHCDFEEQEESYL